MVINENKIPVSNNPGYYWLKHHASNRWFHCQKDDVTGFRLGLNSWTGERTKWKGIPTYDRLEHKVSGLWRHVQADGTTNFPFGKKGCLCSMRLFQDIFKRRDLSSNR